jgi:2-succinyl-5-enolpyruvyl-6-hydroxy-3-cyclohexene-1-carboxylate synthase
MMSDAARAGTHASITVARGRRRIEDDALSELASELSRAERGLIVCGGHDDQELPAAVTALARTLKFPILADPLSGVRCGAHDRSLVIDSYDAVLRQHHLDGSLAPALVIQVGATPTSKPLTQFLERVAPHRIVVDGGAGWRDPSLGAERMLWADPAELLRTLARIISERHRDTRWSERWRCVNRLAREAISQALAAMDEPFEGDVFTVLAETLPDAGVLFAGNSMPVRDLDTFFPSTERRIRFLANRGANGIDGVVSSALGAASHVTGPLVLVIGDLSFYHDLNGLLAAKLHDIAATIVLLNNDGGGIFSFLPQAELGEPFERLFGTPIGLDVRPAVEMYGGTFERVAGRAGLRAALERAASGLRVIELLTDRERNVALHRRVWDAVGAALAREAEVPV